MRTFAPELPPAPEDDEFDEDEFCDELEESIVDDEDTSLVPPLAPVPPAPWVDEPPAPVVTFAAPAPRVEVV